MRSNRFLVIAVASVLALSACGAGPDGNTADAAPSEPPQATTSEGDSPPASTAQGDSPPASTAQGDSPPASTATGNDEYPVLYFAAHGEGSPNTYGPSCSMGIETSSSSMFRVTAPDGWTHVGGLGGSGRTALDFEVDGVRATLYLAAEDSDLVQHPNLELGAHVGTVELPGVTADLVEVTDLGTGSSELSGYGISEVPWLTNLPGGTERAMTVFVTSSDPAVPTLEDATALLSSVRVERCAGIHRAVLLYSISNTLAVPHVENDPLGKPFPGGDQPKYDGSDVLNGWTEEQLAYLLPLPAPADRCAAQKLQDPSVRETLSPTLTANILVLIPMSDADKAALVELSESC